MSDDMFFTDNMRSLRRGKRRAKRTQTCRPCLVWSQEDPDVKMEGVVMDMTPHGMSVRMIDTVPLDTAVEVQLMRDDEFQNPLSAPVKGKIVRNGMADDGFVDHGVSLEVKISGALSRGLSRLRGARQ